jgi:hypothetical protein
MEPVILRDGPFSDDLERFPRLAASAAPAAICCFFDFAGIQKEFVFGTRYGSNPNLSLSGLSWKRGNLINTSLQRGV